MCVCFKSNALHQFGMRTQDPYSRMYNVDVMGRRCVFDV